MIGIKFVALSSKMSEIGPVDGQKSGQIEVRKMMMTNIIGNFVVDNIVFGMEVLAHHPEELSLEIWEFTNFHRVF